MSNDEKEVKLKEALAKVQDVFGSKGVQNINHKPHPYTIGPRHLKENSGVYLNIEECERKGVPCAHPRCNISYADHTSDNVAFLVCIRDANNDEANVALKALVDELGEAFVDGFAFVESEFKITSDEAV